MFVYVENMTHVTISDLGDCRICARLHDLSEIVEHNSPSGHLALQATPRFVQELYGLPIG